MAVKDAEGKETRPITEEGDFLRIKAWDHIEFWVGNAKQAAHYWRTAFGFRPVAYSGLETGNRESASYVLEQGNIRFVVSSPYGPHSAMAAHQMLHGDGVHSLALEVDDVEAAYRETTARGAAGALPPGELRDNHGTLRLAAIRTYGQTVHTFVDRSGYRGAFMPGYRAIKQPVQATPTGLVAIDHVVGNVELGKMNHWVNWYHQVMGFRQIIHYDDKQIHTEYSALMSKVMSSGNGRVKFPINEPAEGRKKSQIEEYLDYYVGPGVQHVAMLTGDIISSVRALRDNGVEFLRVPDTYYAALPERIGKIEEPLEAIAELGILADRDDEGYLLQIFTKPIQDRPTVFIEVIQRHGARGFGVGNFKALFESIELEQQARGNL